MTFPNFGLINQMSKHLANNTSPRVLDYTVNGYDGYRYTPSSNDLVNQPLPVNNSITQQQRFNAMAEQLMFSGGGGGMGGAGVNGSGVSGVYPISTSQLMSNNAERGIINQGNLIDSLTYPQQNYTQPSQLLNSTALEGRINDPSSSKKEPFILGNELLPKDTQSKINIVGTIIILFIVFMLVQLYLSQKKLEFMMSIYKPSSATSSNLHPVMNQSGGYGNNFSSSCGCDEVF